MSWFEVLKIFGVPKSKNFINMYVNNRGQMDEVIALVENMTDYSDFSKVEGVINSLKTQDFSKIWNSAEPFGGKGSSTERNMTEEEAEKKFQELVRAVEKKGRTIERGGQKTIAPLLALAEKLLEEGGNEEKIKQLLSQMEKQTNISSSQREIRARYNKIKRAMTPSTTFNAFVFENYQGIEDLLTKFAQIIGYPYANGEILVENTSWNKIRETFTPNPDKKPSQYTAEDKKKAENLKIWNKITESTKVEFRRGKKVEDITDDLGDLITSSVKIVKTRKLNSYSDVETYLEVVNNSKLKGVKGTWMPDKNSAAGKIKKFPREAFFQQKASRSVRRLEITAVGELILTFPFTEQWFSQLINIVKRENLLDSTSLETALVNDIANSLVNELDRSTQYDINLTNYKTEKLTNLAKKKDLKALREAIRETRDNSTNLNTTFQNKIRDTQQNQSALIEDYFIASEFAKIQPELMKLLEGSKARRRRVEKIQVESFDIRGKKATSGSNPFRRITYTERGRPMVLSPKTLERFLQSYGSIEKETISLEEAQTKSTDIAFELKEVAKDIDALASKENLETTDRKKMKELKVKQEKLNREKVKYDKILRPLKEQEELKEITERLKTLTPEDVAYTGLVNRKETLEREVKPTDTTIENIRRTAKTSFSEYVDTLDLSEFTKGYDAMKQDLPSIVGMSDLDPKNALLMLTMIIRQCANNELGEAFKAIASNPENKEEIIGKLNAEMASVADRAKQGIIDGFDRRLDYFAKNIRTSFSQQQIIPAIDLFIEKGLLRKEEE